MAVPDAAHSFKLGLDAKLCEVSRSVCHGGLAALALGGVLAFGGAEGCTFGPTPAEFASVITHLPPRPVCWYVARDIASGEKSGVVMCDGSAVVDPAELRQAALAEAESLASGAAMVLVSERVDPVAEVGVQCQAVPVIPWSRRSLWKQNICSAVPLPGPTGHFLQLDVHFPASSSVDDKTAPTVPLLTGT